MRYASSLPTSNPFFAADGYMKVIRIHTRSTFCTGVSTITDSSTYKGKTAWRGCGSHVSMVLDSVPADKLCTCEPKVVLGGKEYPPQAK
ncbi:hypothetical protein F4678DRAFT_437234 [Xylaria arbuscula]|nr:hypothetical protein F4678DRAFT_437234 [Xylaria arbuscula]